MVETSKEKLIAGISGAVGGGVLWWFDNTFNLNLFLAILITAGIVLGVQIILKKIV
ncbi:MAG: hypothetical protein ACOC1N_02340 [Bacillota bacterium]